MATIDNLALLSAITVAFACGAAAGRAFAMEGQSRRISILAAAYIGAGAGLLSASLVAFLVVLVGTAIGLRGVLTDWAGAGGAIGQALIWGTACGAGGGLLVGVVVALLVKTYAPRPE